MNGIEYHGNTNGYIHIFGHAPTHWDWFDPFGPLVDPFGHWPFGPFDSFGPFGHVDPWPFWSLALLAIFPFWP
jgi:hypothetical protein